jgi:F-type H+-transporting ATPase subunit b
MLDFPPNWTFAIQFVGFFVLLAVLDRLLFRPFVDVLERRDASTQGTAKAAEIDRRAAADLKGQIDSSLNEAKLLAHAAAEQIRKRTEAEEHALFDEAKAACASHLEATRQALDAEVTAARASLKAEARTLADQMVEALLRKAS